MAVLKSVLRVVGLVALVWIGALLLMQRMILFPRPPVPGLPPVLPAGGVLLELGPDRVEAWLLPPTDADGPASIHAPVEKPERAPAPVIIFTRTPAP